MKSRASANAPTDVYLSFVSSLFDNRHTLFTGMVVHAVSFLAVYARSGAVLYLVLAGLSIVIAAFRTACVLQFDKVDKSRLQRDDIRRWERIYLYGGVSASTLLGIGAGYAVYALRDPFAELVCTAVTMASMVSVVGRNYGSSMAVSLLTSTGCVPIMIGCLARGDMYMTIASGMLVALVLTTRQMANGVREVLYANVIASREIGQIAADFETALSNMTHGLLMIDRERRIQVINRRACDLLQLGEHQRLKQCDLDIVLRYGGNAVDPDARRLLAEELRGLTEGRQERTVVTVDDRILEFSVKLRSGGGAVLIFEDVTERVRNERRMTHMARYDSVTGLANRSYFQQLVEERLRARTDDGATGFMLLDINDFRHVNDMKGHAVGDQLLAAVGARVASMVEERSLVGRLASDRFVIFFESAESAAALESTMRSLFAALAGAYEAAGLVFDVSFSAGCFVLPRRGPVLTEWQVKCDLALYESKARGKSVLTFFAQEMDVRYLERQRLKADLRVAIETNALSVVYQPMFSVDGSRIVCCEALSRWMHPKKGAVPPNIFIDIAEEMGIVSEITETVLRRACRDALKWPEHIGVSVNLSERDLLHGDLVARVKAVLADTGLAADRLHLEVTEHSLIEEMTTVRGVLEELRRLGIHIAIDDFGTGFSSLSYLDSLPVDIVKIDRSFVRDITEDERRLKLLKGVVRLSRELDLKIVVEGVETEAQLALLAKHRCADLVQGYVFSPPVAVDEIPVLDARAEENAGKRRTSVA